MIFNSVRQRAAIGQEIPADRDGFATTQLFKNGDAEIRVDGVIGGDLWGTGITKEDFSSEMKKVKGAKTLHLRINSEGGSVFDAEAMYALLRGSGSRIVVHIDSLAASAASFLAMAGDEIEISQHAMVMIHNPFMLARGDDEAMMAAAALLSKKKGQIADTYASRTGQKKDQVLTWMKDETYFDSAEATKYGFATKVIENHRIAACIRYPDRMLKLPAALRPNTLRAHAALARIAALKA